MANAVVLTGAGASHDCASNDIAPDESSKPPLVKDLFANIYKPTLERYPLVRQAATDIRQATRASGESAIPLEASSREQMRASKSPYTQRRYRQVPLYLQDVLSQASAYTREPDNYNALVNAALELDDVLFLTLNYDTLLDTRLSEYRPVEDLGWYVDSDPRWALVKLHGSVNWGWRLELPPDLTAAATIEWANKLIDEYGDPGPLQFDNDDIHLRLHRDVAHRRYDGSESAVFYPALAIPLGEQDDLVCPSRHVEVALERLRSPDGINLLVIGYSGADREVLRLFSESGNSIRQLLVANGSSEMARQAAERIAQAFGGISLRDEWIVPGGFSDLISSHALQRWMAEIA